MSERAEQVLKYFRENESWMEDRIASGIEANRKGWLKLHFVDSEGNPVENVQIELEQKTHDFKFGCNLFMLDELETEEKNEKFKEMYPQLFNLATLPFYWANLEPRPGFLRFEKDSPLFKYIKEGDCVYFVHSFYAEGCADSLIADTEYGRPVTAAVQSGNVFGCQFHPEKSGTVGLNILKAFCEV